MGDMTTFFKNTYLAQNQSRIMTDFAKFISFKSISADPDSHPECFKCVEWLKDYITTLGFKSELIKTPRLPLLYAEFDSNLPGSTVLYYGHYDVQPPEPLELWQTDPFTLTEKEGRLYSRGAQDNKGQSWFVIEALGKLIKEKKLKGKVKILLEGEEECGSRGLSEVLATLKEKLKSDLLLVCDTGTLVEEKGAITMGLRGIVHMEFALDGPARDLHSGIHGGVAPNPIHAVAGMIASLHDAEGKIAVPGFYDSVINPSEEDLKLSESFPIPEAFYHRLTGVLPVGGEKGLSLPVRRGFRPTIEVNGITGGYQGSGSKTIIPSTASAKLSMRIVGGQKPEEVLELVTSYLKLKTPFGMNFRVVEQAAAGKALLLSSNTPVVKKAASVIKNITNQEPIYLWEGASIPIVSSLAEISGAVPILVGWGLDEDHIHAPNESFKISQFEKGFMFCEEFLEG